jgi:5-methylcytosine-specific restriction endonuclease McrA
MASTVRQFPMPVWPCSGKYGWCKWCGDAIPVVIDGKKSTQRMWHPACLREYELHTRANVQLDFLVERDGRRCACCPEGTPVPRKWLHDQYGHREFQDTRRFYTPKPEDLAQLWPTDPVKGKRWHEMTPEERGYGEHFRVWLVDALEVDHRVPLWEVTDLPDQERRWYFGPGNLWLLCPRHHREKTAREAARRAHLRRLERAQFRLDL